MENLLPILRAITDPTRLRLLILLREEELSVAELQEILGMGQSRISSHLSLLRKLGLVTDRRVGKNSYYSAREDMPSALAGVWTAAAEEIPETAQDRTALALTLRKRKDRATEFFNRLAGKFGRTYIPGRSWQGLAHAVLRLLPPMEIADLGAGEGTLSQLLARNARRVVAVDNSPEMVAYGARIAAENGVTNLQFLCGDMEEVPLPAASVDLALFSQALHHAASPTRAVKEAFRIIRPGGRVLILDLAAHTREEVRELYAHVWLGFTEIELHELLRKAGGQKVEVSVVSTEPQAPHFRTILATAIK
jgi:ubiquinone/menaquinone biosynthesis C-methylase UbiE/biotin operon repressor